MPRRLRYATHRPVLRRWPRLPRSITLAGGRVAVRLHDNPKMLINGEMRPVLGFADSCPRQILIKRSLPPAQRWATLLHEMVHIALWDVQADAGLTGLEIDRVCDAVGLAWMHWQRYNLGLRA